MVCGGFNMNGGKELNGLNGTVFFFDPYRGPAVWCSCPDPWQGCELLLDRRVEQKASDRSRVSLIGEPWKSHWHPLAMLGELPFGI